MNIAECSPQLLVRVKWRNIDFSLIRLLRTQMDLERKEGGIEAVQEGLGEPPEDGERDGPAAAMAA